MNLAKRIIKIILSISAHVLIVVILYKLFVPIGEVFYYRDVPPGNDTSNFMYYTQEFRNNLAFPVSAWKMGAFEGMPRLVDTSWLHFYLIQPLVSYLGIMPATKIYPIAFLLFFIAASYLLFYEVSRNYLLAASLALILLKTGNIYLPLFSSGVVLSSISQTFFPLTFYFLVRFFKRKENSSFYLAAVMLSLAVFTHPGVGDLITVVSTVIFFILISSSDIRFLDYSAKFKLAFKFFFITGMLMSVAVLPDVYTKLVEGGHQWMVPVFKVQEGTLELLLSTVNPTLFITFLISLFVGLFFFKNINKFVLPLLGIAAYFLLLLGSMYLGINPLTGIFFPHRFSWMFVVSLLAATAALLAPANFNEFSKVKQGILIFFGFILIPAISLTNLTLPTSQVLGFMGDISRDAKYDKLATDPIQIWSKSLLGTAKADLSFFEESNLQYRFYAMDYVQNLHLGFLSRQPQNRGGFHYSTAKNVDWYAWYDAVLAEESQMKWRISPYMAQQQSLYLIDWYATKYIYSWPGIPGMIASWFTREDSPYVSKRTVNNNIMMLRIGDEYISPIVAPSNAKVIGFIGSRQGYDSLLRNLGILDYNSKFIIPIHVSEHLDDVKLDKLKDMDGLIIYLYQGKDKGQHPAFWQTISDFVKKGGVVLVDTSSDAPEKDIDKLPDIFPVEKITSGHVDTTWKVNQVSDTFSNINFSSLSPLIWEGDNWKVTYADQIRNSATTDLNLSGKIVIAQTKVGEGRFIWSGLNLFFRPLYYSKNAEQESKILKNILDKEFLITKKEIPKFDFQRPKSEEIILSSDNARGVLFKENNYGGWVANVITDNKSKNLKIYPAGPDFMYVKLPQEYSKNFKLVFRYVGRLENWIFLGFTILGMIYVVDGIITKGRFLKFTTLPFVNLVRRLNVRVFGWWEKEDE